MVTVWNGLLYFLSIQGYGWPNFLKPIHPGKNNCFLINPLEFNLNLDNLIPSEKKVWTWKIFWVCHLEKGKLCKFTPWKNMPWDRNPWKKSQSRDTLDFYVHTYPCMDKKWNSLILGYSRKKMGEGGTEEFFILTIPLLEIPDKTKLQPWKFQKNCGIARLCLTWQIPWKFQAQKPRPLEILHYFFLVTLGNSSLFLTNPWKFDMLFLWYPWKFHILPPAPSCPVCFFSGIAHYCFVTCR